MPTAKRSLTSPNTPSPDKAPSSSPGSISGFHDPALKDIFTAPDPETGEPGGPLLNPSQDFADDLLKRAKALGNGWPRNWATGRRPP